MRADLLPAIEALKGEVADLEAKLASTQGMINRLCELAGVSQAYPDVGSPQRTQNDAVRADQFYGKSMSTAARELLEARNAAGRGPALPREIYDALVAGGLQFDTSNEANRLSSLRQMLRKNSSIFHKLPNGQYGLLAWYPAVKASKSNEEGQALASIKKAVPVIPHVKPRIERTRAPLKSTHPRSGQPVGPSFDEFALLALADGKAMSLADLKQRAIEFGDVGVDESTDLRSLNMRLLGLLRQGRVVALGKGTWSLKKETASSVGADEAAQAFKGAA